MNILNILNSCLKISFSKNFKLITTLLFITLCIIKTGKLYSQIGCMDNSKHTNLNLGYDYKTPYYVKCACDCKSYEILAKHGNKCSKCLHLRAPVQTVIVSKYVSKKLS